MTANWSKTQSVKVMYRGRGGYQCHYFSPIAYGIGRPEVYGGANMNALLKMLLEK